MTWIFDKYNKYSSDLMRNSCCDIRSISRVIMPLQRIHTTDLVRADTFYLSASTGIIFSKRNNFPCRAREWFLRPPSDKTLIPC